MPAAAIKGIIISISIITALGIAVLENPQIQAWLEQQRQKIIELLRNLNEELDPQSRRTAEAFAYEGRTLANDSGLRREASGSLEAAAVATGRSLSNPSTIRRIPVHGPSDPDEAEERRRKGREYLAQRNQQMYELKQRKKSASADGEEPTTPATPTMATPLSPTSFDAFVDLDGRLKQVESETDKGKRKAILLPAGPSLEDVPDHIQDEMRELKMVSPRPLSIGESSSSASAWQLGSQLANPFGDEFALDRSATPKPPVPPKIAIEAEDEPRTPTMPGSFTPRQPEANPEENNVNHAELSYEEQLAIALSLSEAEAAKAAVVAVKNLNASDEEDAELRAAIEASLKEIPHTTPATLPPTNPSQLLVDLSPPSPIQPTPRSPPRGHWETLFDQSYSPTHEPLSLVSPISRPSEDEEDELYRITPQLTRARLASLDAQRLASPSSTSSRYYDPVRDAASVQGPSTTALEAAMEADLFSSPAPSSSAASRSTRTMDHDHPIPQSSIPVSDTAASHDTRPSNTLSRHSSSRTFHTDSSDSESATFASFSPPAVSRPVSAPRSEISNAEVVDVEEDSDVDLLSEEGDGVLTPDSWTEVGSRDGESEGDEVVRNPWRRRRVL